MFAPYAERCKGFYYLQILLIVNTTLIFKILQVQQK